MLQTVACDAIPAAVTLTAMDNCNSPAIVTASDSRTDGACPNTYTITRTWTASDCSGNTATATQVINVQDIRPPVFLDAVPADVVSFRLRVLPFSLHSLPLLCLCPASTLYLTGLASPGCPPLLNSDGFSAYAADCRV